MTAQLLVFASFNIYILCFYYITFEIFYVHLLPVFSAFPRLNLRLKPKLEPPCPAGLLSCCSLSQPPSFVAFGCCVSLAVFAMNSVEVNNQIQQMQMFILQVRTTATGDATQPRDDATPRSPSSRPAARSAALCVRDVL